MTQQEHIETLVASGAYASAHDVIAEGLRLIALRDELAAQADRALRAAVQEGLDAVAAGEVTYFANAAELDDFIVALTDPAAAA
jgi:putative addiction module CopG family antidote